MLNVDHAIAGAGSAGRVLATLPGQAPDVGDLLLHEASTMLAERTADRVRIRAGVPAGATS